MRGGLIRRLLVLLGSVVLAGGCAPVFSDLQSARLVGPGRVEVTPSGSALFFSDDEGMEHVEDHYGVQLATGVGERADLRLRYERVVGAGVNVVGFGPKLGLARDRLALALPVGLAFGADIAASQTWEFHPTLLFTQPLSPRAELNASAKSLIPIAGEDRDTLWAVNVGLGLGQDLRRFVLRPEVGLLFNPGEKGHYLHASLGVTFYTGERRGAP